MKTAALSPSLKGMTMFNLPQGFPGWLLLLFGHLIVAALGFIDYLTGDYAILVFYLVPIFIVAWFVGGRGALLISLFAGLARVLSDYLSYADTSFMYWDSLLDMSFLVMAGLLIALLKKLLVDEESRLKDMPR
jgi:hypothetical protein